MVAYAGYFWPIAECKQWRFRATTTREIDMQTVMMSHDLHDGWFNLTIEKSHPWTYWGPEARHETLCLYCRMDNDGIWMAGYNTKEKGIRTKEFWHKALIGPYGALPETPWKFSAGWPVYPFIPEGSLWEVGKWFDLHQTIYHVPHRVFANNWETRATIEKINVPFLGADVDCLRMDYLETNTPCHLADYGNPCNDTEWQIDLFDGPVGRRPIRVNEQWWFAWGLGPVKVRHCHNKYENGVWSGPCDLDWKYGPVHEIELIEVR